MKTALGEAELGIQSLLLARRWIQLSPQMTLLRDKLLTRILAELVDTLSKA